MIKLTDLLKELDLRSGELEGSFINDTNSYGGFFNSFDFTVTKRGQYNDLWDVTIDLVEV